ncbi:unnamed protein product, partial [Ranitomeya imitator]
MLTGSSTEDKVNTEEITFESLKKAIDNTGMEEQEKEKRRQVIEKFQKAPFEEIAAQCESKANLLHEKLAQILELTIRPPPSPSGTITITAGHAQYQSVPIACGHQPLRDSGTEIGHREQIGPQHRTSDSHLSPSTTWPDVSLSSLCDGKVIVLPMVDSGQLKEGVKFQAA